MEMLQLNIFSLVSLTKLFLAEMTERKQGKMLNIASDAAYFPSPLMAVYSATKVFVLSFSSALSREVKQYRVTVTTFCPGVTETDFHKSAKMENALMIKKKKHFSPEKVAQLGYEALSKNKSIVVCGLLNRLNIFMIKFIPNSIVLDIGFNMLKMKGDKKL